MTQTSMKWASGVRGRVVRPAPSWFAAPAAVGVTIVLLMSAVALGVQLPGFGVLGDVGEESLDYSAATRGGFRPLSDAYLSRVLGLPKAEVSTLGAGGSAATRTAARAGGP